MTRQIRLKLYVMGTNSCAEQNLDRLKEYLQSESPTNITSEVIDVLTAPNRAEDARVIATPTLVKEAPLPARKVIGDLSDMERIISFLGLREIGTEPNLGDCG